MFLFLEECFCIGSLVPTKAVLYWLILGTCEGSIFHRFYDLKLRIASKYLSVVQVTDELHSTQSPKHDRLGFMDPAYTVDRLLPYGFNLSCRGYGL